MVQWHLTFFKIRGISSDKNLTHLFVAKIWRRSTSDTGTPLATQLNLHLVVEDWSASGRNGIFAKSTRCNISRQNTQLWNSQWPECPTASPNREIPATLVRPCVQNTPTKDWRGKYCWLNPRESGPEDVKGPGGVTTSPTLLGPVLVLSKQNYLKLLLAVTYFKSF